LSEHLPTLKKVSNFLKSNRAKLIQKNYPDFTSEIQEIYQRKFNPQLENDSLFTVDSILTSDDCVILLTTKALVENFTQQKQSAQPSFIHINLFYDLVATPLPILQISTETANHEFRPIAYCLLDKETEEKIAWALKTFSDFMKKYEGTDFKPEYVLADNCKTIVGGLKDAFTHTYIHLFSLSNFKKKIRDKFRLKSYTFTKTLEKIVEDGIKWLKNALSQENFEQRWRLVMNYWEIKDIPE